MTRPTEHRYDRRDQRRRPAERRARGPARFPDRLVRPERHRALVAARRHALPLLPGAALAGTTHSLIGDGFGYRYERLDLPISMRAQVVNGYLYFSWKPLGPGTEARGHVEQYVGKLPRAHAVRRRLLGARGSRAPRAVRRDRRVEVDELPAEQLAEAWDGAWGRAQRAWAIHFYAITGPYQVMDDLADLYESVVEKRAAGRGAAADPGHDPRAGRGRRRRWGA